MGKRLVFALGLAGLVGFLTAASDFIRVQGQFILAAKTVGTLGACGSPQIGGFATVTDSSVNTWGSNVAGGGAIVVGVFCNGGGTWTVVAK